MQFTGHWFKYPDIKPRKKGVYIVCLKSETHGKHITMCQWNCAFWELSKIEKSKNYEVVYWTHQLPYPEEI